MPSLVLGKVNDSVLAFVTFTQNAYYAIVNERSVTPHYRNQLSDVLGSIPYFMPEIYLTVLFVLVLVTDLIIW
jgi:hypothetical protein